MAREIKLKCPTCGHEWTEDLDKEQARSITYRGPTRKETYSFRCPKDGTYVAVEVEIEE